MNLFKRVSLLMILASPLAAFAESANNKISMVTFFPVPYVAYNRVNATEEMDIGLRSCNLTLGSTGSTNQPLSVTNTKVTSGNLALNNASAVNVQNQLSLGIPNRFGPATLKFKNLYVGSVSNGGSVNTDSMVVNGLSLFNRNFPSCVAKVSSGQIAWASLALGPNPDKKEIFLTCGGDQTCHAVLPEYDPCESGDVTLAVMEKQGITVNSTEFTFARFGKIWNVRNATPVTCGLKERKKKCNLDANPPAWTWSQYWMDAYDTSSCYTDYSGATRTFQSCSDYFANATNPSYINGWTIEGNVKEIKTVTKDDRGMCTESLSLDTSDCRGYKMQWQADNDSAGWTPWEFTYLPQGQYAGYYTQSGLEFRWGACARHDCNIGVVAGGGTCSSASDINNTQEEIYRQQVGSGYVQCRVGWPTSSGFQELVSGISPYYTYKYQCKKRVNKCVKKCRALRMDDDGELYFVNSVYSCN